MRRCILCGALALLALCLATPEVYAQSAGSGRGTPLKNFPVFPVGARPIGMGGAFIALADDVSATYWNPAGLAYLPSPELTIQAQFIDYEYEQPFNGSYDVGPPEANNINYRTYENDAFTPSLVGFVYPNRILPFGISVARIIEYEEVWESEDIFLSRGVQLRPYEVFGEVTGTNINLSAAKNLGRGWNIGLNLKYTIFEFTSNGTQQTAQQGTILSWDVSSTGGGFSFDIGTIYEVSDTISLGAVLRWGEQIEYEDTFFNSVDQQVFNELKEFPAKLGVGISWFALQNLIVSGDVYYVRNSRLAEHINLPAYDQADDRFELNDGIEAHIGAEYTIRIRERHNLAFRLGGYFEPSRDVYYERSDSLDDLDVIREDQLTVYFPEGDDAIHFTAGFGYGLELGGGNSVGFDLAANVADEQTQYIFGLQWYIGSFRRDSF